jgi:hypothetical protein
MQSVITGFSFLDWQTCPEHPPLTQSESFEHAASVESPQNPIVEGNTFLPS